MLEKSSLPTIGNCINPIAIELKRVKNVENEWPFAGRLKKKL